MNVNFNGARNFPAKLKVHGSSSTQKDEGIFEQNLDSSWCFERI